ncbi:methylmalonyl-CoA mutase family protein [bacterium]|nr:methylmalonyl-CoA mutase family protein [bacterium]
MDDIEEIRRRQAAWESGPVAKLVGKNPERRAEFKTTSNVPIRRLYTPADRSEANYLEELGMPGEYPFTRGVQPNMYRGRFWTMRQYAGFGTAEESNTRYRYLLDQGQTGLSVAFDLPTQMGRDSDHMLARGEVGRVGVAIDSLADMETMLAGIPLDKVTTSMTINATASILLALYLAVAEKQNVPWTKVGGTIQNDILKEYVARGTYVFPPRPSLRIITDIFAFCSKDVPNWNTISISGYHIREAGSTAAQEVAFTIANGIAYVEAALAAGLAIDDFAPRLSFFWNVHNDFFEEIAKFRVARRIWARIVRDRFEAKDPRSMTLRCHAQTAGSSLTAQQVDNNVVRVSLQALAAVLGGTQSLHTNGKDEALALPTEETARLALRTQQVIAHESGAADTVDPLAGSYFVESLTDELQKRIEDYLAQIEDQGGAVSSIEQGFMQREIQNSAFRYQQEIETKDRVIVGVNQFTLDKEPMPDILRIKPELEERQKAKVAKVRAERSADAAAKALERVESTARGDGNLMPTIVDAVRAYCTLGEISDAMRRVFGEYRPEVML